MSKAIEAALREGYELSICRWGHVIVWKACEEHPVQVCLDCTRARRHGRTWWLLDAPDVEAAYKIGGLDAAVTLWCARFGIQPMNYLARGGVVPTFKLDAPLYYSSPGSTHTVLGMFPKGWPQL